MERIFARQGLPLARSTICGWHAELADLVRPLVVAMWQDAFTAPYLCADATGVLVQSKEKCRNGHFWVVAAPERHVLFAYTPKQTAEIASALLAGYKGTLVVDAHAVYNHLFKNGDIVEAGCWAHARRYWWKALTTDPERAQIALALIGGLFRIERAHATAPPERRLAIRKLEATPILEKYFAWCDAEAERVLDETPSAKAIGYSRNQRAALSRFLEDGRIPIHNNPSYAAGGIRRVMPRPRLCRATRAGQRRRRAACQRSRHNHRPSRKASTRSVARYRRGGRPVVVARPRARSFSCRSAWM
jgi:hypothetical protein